VPLFSVVIPTKARSYLVGYAVQSVLNQTCGDAAQQVVSLVDVV
jgi:glycosyltransferase involved in cell wall biosynthesis